MIYRRLRRIFVRLQGVETGADNKLCNGFRNAEGGHKDKQEAVCHLTEIALTSIQPTGFPKAIRWSLW